MEEKKEKIKSVWIKGMLAGFGSLALAIILFMFIYNFKSVKKGFDSFISLLMPFIIGAALAYLVAPLCNRLEIFFGSKMKRKKLAASLAITLSMLFELLIVYLLLIMIIPQMYYSIVSLTNTLPAKAEKFIQNIQASLASNPTLQGYVMTAYESIRSAFSEWVSNKLLPDLSGVIGGVGTGVLSVVNGIKNTIIGIVVAFYCLAGRKTFAVQSKKILYSISGRRWGDMIYNETKYADRMFSGFLTGKLVDSLIIGLLCYLFCVIANMPNALLISVIIGVTNIIPFFGPFIGAVPSALLILIENPGKCLWFVIFIIILQQVDGNIIGPKILGDSTGLSSFWILFAILVFGGWFGFIGMIIGVPLFAVIYDIVAKLVRKGLAKHSMGEECFEAQDRPE